MNATWRAWFALAVRRFGLSPEAFWTLTLAEWRALLRACAGPRPLDRAGLAALMAAYPDED